METFIFLPDTVGGSYQLAAVLKMLLAAAGGAVIGLEREKHGRPAGLRTHLLVSLGSCLIMIISEAFALKYQGGADSVLRLDPARTAAQIVTGIGFLGAGVILKEGLAVRGLTTAASLWMVAGLGMAFGIGLLGPALAGTVIALFSLVFLKRLEGVIKKDRYLYLTVVGHHRPGIYQDLEQILTAHRLRIADLQSEIDMAAGQVRYEFVITRHHVTLGRSLTEEIVGLDGVLRVRFR